MSFEEQDFKTELNTNGSTTAFATTFQILQEDDLLVTYLASGDAEESALTLTTDYTVSIHSTTKIATITTTGGSSPYATGTIVLSRNTEKSQEQDWTEGGPFSTASVEYALDKQGFQVDEATEKIDRTMKIQLNDDQTVDLTLPLKANRTSKFLSFNADGKPIATSGGVTVPVTAYMETLLDDPDSATARETLEIREVPAGGIQAFGGASAPTGYLLCDGSAVSRTTYADLFTAIATVWGVGDGSTTFNLPDLREASPIGVGETGETVVAHDALTLAEFADDQLQGHWHADTQTRDNAVGNTVALARGVNDDFPLTLGQADPSDDGSNGTPRTGTTTHGKIIGVNYIIRY